MKHYSPILFSALLLASLGLGVAGCVGYVDDGPGYYHRGWYNDGPWMGGPRGFVEVGVHPMRR
jgi:hypothetical protein